MRIKVIGGDARSLACKDYLSKESALESLIGDMIILPIPTTRDGRSVTGSSLPLSSVAGELKRGDVAVGYGLPRDFVGACLVRGAETVDLALDEEYLGEGAYLTSVGCVEYILASYDTAPSELRVGIIGLGRIGSYLASHLIGLGASVRAFSSKRKSTLDGEILSYGALSEGQALSDLDILINTAPSRLLSERAAEQLTFCEIIELASGDNIPSEIKFTALPRLPAKAFPRSAGYSAARAVLRALS